MVKQKRSRQIIQKTKNLKQLEDIKIQKEKQEQGKNQLNLKKKTRNELEHLLTPITQFVNDDPKIKKLNDKYPNLNASVEKYEFPFRLNIPQVKPPLAYSQREIYENEYEEKYPFYPYKISKTVNTRKEREQNLEDIISKMKKRKNDDKEAMQRFSKSKAKKRSSKKPKRSKKHKRARTKRR